MATVKAATPVYLNAAMETMGLFVKKLSDASLRVTLKSFAK